MSSSERYERRLPELLDELASPRTPAYFDDILGQVDRTRQRPGWTFPERWLPMSAVSERLATAPRVPLRAIALAALLLIALAVSLALIAGSQHAKVPAPFGPAHNGAIAYADAAGDIFVGDPADGTSRAIVTGPSKDTLPVFSPDGTKIAFLRGTTTMVADVVVVDADGSHARVITNEPILGGIGYLSWTPDSSHVTVGIPQSGLVTLDAATTSAPKPLAQISAFSSNGVPWNNQVTHIFRPPKGDQILQLESRADGWALVVVDLADGARRSLIDLPTAGIDYDAELNDPVWSPDGSQIAFGAKPADGPGRIYVMNADGTALRALDNGPQAASGCLSPCQNFDDEHPAWSPDGTRIAVMRWLDIPGAGPDNWADWIRPINVFDVATGTRREVGRGNMNGFIGWGWSPDGTSILEVPDSDPTPGGGNPQPHHIQVVDATTGAVRSVDWDVDSAGSWQRTAP